jgi:ABC-type Fe3+/spermidine/putrescine transport system ATPase subunit
VNANAARLVELERLTKRFGNETAVNDVSLAIGEGEFITLLGPSGCGKTTTLRCIAGLERPDAGNIRIDRKVVASSDGVYLYPEQRDIGMVFQSYAVWPHMTVFDNVAYGLRVRRVPAARLRKLTMEALELVGLAQLADRYATKLSGGQRQRVALARAIVYRPKVVLFDEPLSNLDAKLREQMRVELARLQREVGVTSIYVTHDQAEALVMSDRVVVMNNGIVQQIGDLQTIYWQPANTFVARFIGVASVIESTVLGRANGCCDVEVQLASGQAPLVLRIACRDRLERGAKLAVCLRPEDLVLHLAAPNPARHVNVLQGEVTATAYLGTYVECRARVGGYELCVQTPHAHELGIGQVVFLTFEPDAAIAVTQ